MLAKLFTLVLWLFVGAVTVLVSGYLVLMTVNWQDEVASPDTLTLQSVLENQQESTPEFNGYQYLLQQSQNLTVPRSTLLEQVFSPCHDACHSALLTRQSELTVLLEQQQAILEVYRTLLTFNHWQESLPATSEKFPSYSLLHYAHRLYLVDIWLITQQGDMATANTLLQNDYLFWRNILAKNTSLLSYAVTRSALNTHFQFAEHLLFPLTPEQQQVVIPSSWQTPFVIDASSLEHVYAGEWLHIKSLSQHAIGMNDATKQQDIAEQLMGQLIKPFLLQQATLNELASTILSCTRQREITQPSGFNWLYNPIGKLLNNNAQFDCDLSHLDALEQQRLGVLANYAST